MQVNARAFLGFDCQSKLDIRKNQSDVTESTFTLFRDSFLVFFNAAIIGDPERADRRNALFNLAEKSVPWITSRIAVV